MSTIVVNVMPKAELLDPQGKAVAGALHRSGHGHFDVRIGKRFELITDEPIDDELLTRVQTIAEEVLSNGVIEDVISVSTLDEGAPSPVDREATR